MDEKMEKFFSNAMDNDAEFQKLINDNNDESEKNGNSMKLWWKCPCCGEDVNFTEEMSFVFDEDGEADFDPKRGLTFHTIVCDCGANWIISISEVNKL